MHELDQAHVIDPQDFSLFQYLYISNGKLLRRGNTKFQRGNAHHTVVVVESRVKQSGGFACRALMNSLAQQSKLSGGRYVPLMTASHFVLCAKSEVG